jgi:hypothetical protein
MEKDAIVTTWNGKIHFVKKKNSVKKNNVAFLQPGLGLI